MSKTSLIDELKRRNVIKLLTAYAVAGFVILQLCDILFPALGIADEVIGYVLIALLIGLPLIGMLSWNFEITPDGFKRSREVDAEESISQFTGQRINLAIILLLSVAVVFFAYEYFTGPAEVEVVSTEVIEQQAEEPVPTAPIDTRPSIAVLPFVNMSSDEENEYFSDGLTEEMLNLLAQTEGLRVAGRTSSFFYKDKNENLTIIGEALNVNHILEGSVRKSGDKVRITAQLISADDGFHLWSNTFDRELTDIFAVQDEIAGEVTRALELTLLTDSVVVTDRATTSPESYEMYLRAKALLYQRTRESTRLSIDLFREAYTLDPAFAPAYIDGAIAEMVLQSNHTTGNLEDVMIRAKALLDKAAELENFSADYYAALGLYYSNTQGIEADNFSKAADAFERALAVNPNNVRAYMWYASAMVAQSPSPDRWQQGFELIEKAATLDPLNRVANSNYVVQLADMGNIDESIRILKRLIRTEPDYQGYRTQLVNLHLSRFDLANAADALTDVSLAHSNHPFLMLQLLITLNDEAAYIDYLGRVPLENPVYESVVPVLELSFSGTAAELRAEAELLLLRQNPNLPYALLFGLMSVEEWSLVRQLIENARPYLTDGTPLSSHYNNDDPNFPYMLSLMETGDIERAREWARFMLDYHSTTGYIGPRGKGAADSGCYLVLGDSQRALESFEEAVDAGWLGFYQIRMDDLDFASAAMNEPRVIETRKRIDEQLDAQRPAVYQTLREAGLISSM